MQYLENWYYIIQQVRLCYKASIIFTNYLSYKCNFVYRYFKNDSICSIFLNYLTNV